MHQLFRILFTAIVALLLFHTTKVLGIFDKWFKRGGHEAIQESVNQIFSSKLEQLKLFKKLQRAGIKNVISIYEVPQDLVQFKNLLSKNKIRVVFAPVPNHGSTMIDILHVPEVNELVRDPHQTLVVDFDSIRVDQLRGSFPVVLNPYPFSLQGFTFDIGASSWSKILQRNIDFVQGKVDQIFKVKNLTFSEDTVGQLLDAGIKNVILPLNVSTHMLQFHQTSLQYKFGFFFSLIEDGATNLREQMELDLPTGFDFAHSLVTDWSRERLDEISQLCPVVINSYWFTWMSLRPYQPFPADSFQMTQASLNEFVTEEQKERGQLNTRSLVEFLHKGKVEAVAMKFHGVVVGRRGPLFMSRNGFDKEQIAYEVSNDLKEFVHELQRMGIGFYVIDYSDPNVKFCRRLWDMQPIMAGKELMLKVLDKQRIYPIDGLGLHPDYYQAFGNYNKINPEKQEKDKMPYDTTPHLQRMQMVTHLTRGSILLIDDDLCNCQKADEINYPALYVKHLPEDKRGFFLDQLHPVEERKSDAGPCKSKRLPHYYHHPCFRM